jgi:hypothetical protein
MLKFKATVKFLKVRSDVLMFLYLDDPRREQTGKLKKFLLEGGSDIMKSNLKIGQGLFTKQALTKGQTECRIQFNHMINKQMAERCKVGR